MPAHDPLFDSAWLKWAWAVRQAKTLEADIAAFGSDPDRPPVITCRTEYQPDRDAMVVLVDSLPVLPVEWNLMLGDIAFAYRCALDHTAWAVVSRGATPPNTLRSIERNGIYFPIAENDRAFDGLLSPPSGSCQKHSYLGYLPGASPADIAIIRRFQPYNRGEACASFQVLTMVSRLNNDDKHKTIQPVLVLPTQARLHLGTPFGCLVTGGDFLTAKSDPLEVNAEVAVIPIRKLTDDSEPKLDVQCEFAAQICLYNRVTIVDWMDNLWAWIGTMLQEFSGPPVQMRRIVPSERWIS